MEHFSLERSYLETLTTDDLVLLGDKFGVDIPPALNRRLIIGELLEIQESLLPDEVDHYEADEFADENAEDVPPESYCETRINILLRNPGWLFAFWDFSVADFSASTQRRGFESFGLRVSFFDNASLTKSRDSYNTAVSPSDRKWYIHVPEQRCFCRVDLLTINKFDRDFVLAQSNVLALPSATGIEISKCANEEAPPILSLSGVEELRRKYRRNHRQSFV